MDSSGYNLLLSVLVACVGWVVVHRLNVTRDISARRRELRIQYLLEAYRRLEAAANRDTPSVAEAQRAFESALADIQLLGTKYQITSLVEYLHAHVASGSSDIDPVLELLRADLRRELALEQDVPRVLVFRFGKHMEKRPSLSKGSPH